MVAGMNAFAACLILSQTSSVQLFSLTPGERTEMFGQLLGTKRMVRARTSPSKAADSRWDTGRTESCSGAICCSAIFAITHFRPDRFLKHTTMIFRPTSYSLAECIYDVWYRGVFLFEVWRRKITTDW